MSVSISIQSKVNQFYQGIMHGEILLTVCRRCGAKYLPPRADCSECYSSDLAWEKLGSNNGRVLTYTTILSPPESFEGKQPYTDAVIELDNGLRVLGVVEETKATFLEIGSAVKLLPRQDNGRFGFKIVEA